MVTLAELKRRAGAAADKNKKKVPLEKEVEKPVKEYAKRKGLWVRKFMSENNRSVPDDIFSTPSGTVFFVEFKRPGGKPTPAQLDEHNLMRKAGLNVHVVDTVEAGKALIDDYLTWEE